MHRTLRNYLWWLGLSLLAGWVIWFSLLMAFLGEIPRQSQRHLPKADAIIVLTGSLGRIDHGIELFKQGVAERVFISGLPRDADTEQLLVNLPKPQQKCCVGLGFAASDTRGNAVESAAFVREQGIRTVVLVTADFHMPRSLIEFRRLMPQTVIIPEPVITKNPSNGQWWRQRQSLFLILREFHKYTRARLSSFLSSPE
ncbi:MAG: YdcF family protein [Alphaproteobacteria bacterium]|nr:YdcF family protein [Alphaproteobacteria bacterium]